MCGQNGVWLMGTMGGWESGREWESVGERGREVRDSCLKQVERSVRADAVHLHGGYEARAEAFLVPRWSIHEFNIDRLKLQPVRLGGRALRRRKAEPMLPTKRQRDTLRIRAETVGVEGERGLGGGFGCGG